MTSTSTPKPVPSDWPAMPDWVKSCLVDAALMARGAGAMRRSLEKYAHQHRAWRRARGAEDRDVAEVDTDATCDVIAYNAAASELSPTEMDAQISWYRTVQRRSLQLPYMLPLLSKDSIEELQRLGYSAPDWDASDGDRDQAAIIAELVRFLDRLKGEAKRRRAMHLLMAFNEPGVSLIIHNSEDGEPDVQLLHDMSAHIGTRATG